MARNDSFKRFGSLAPLLKLASINRSARENASTISWASARNSSRPRSMASVIRGTPRRRERPDDEAGRPYLAPYESGTQASSAHGTNILVSDRKWQRPGRDGCGLRPDWQNRLLGAEGICTTSPPGARVRDRRRVL